MENPLFFTRKYIHSNSWLPKPPCSTYGHRYDSQTFGTPRLVPRHHLHQSPWSCRRLWVPIFWDEFSTWKTAGGLHGFSVNLPPMVHVPPWHIRPKNKGLTIGFSLWGSLYPKKTSQATITTLPSSSSENFDKIPWKGTTLNPEMSHLPGRKMKLPNFGYPIFSEKQQLVLGRVSGSIAATP